MSNKVHYTTTRKRNEKWEYLMTDRKTWTRNRSRVLRYVVSEECFFTGKEIAEQVGGLLKSDYLGKDKFQYFIRRRPPTEVA